MHLIINTETNINEDKEKNADETLFSYFYFFLKKFQHTVNSEAQAKG